VRRWRWRWRGGRRWIGPGGRLTWRRDGPGAVGWWGRIPRALWWWWWRLDVMLVSSGLRREFVSHCDERTGTSLERVAYW
jgi:hypothetical protein